MKYFFIPLFLLLSACVGAGGVGPLDPLLSAAGPVACTNAKYYLNVAAGVAEAGGVSPKTKHNLDIAIGEVEMLCQPGMEITAVTAVRLAKAYSVIRSAMREAKA